jgi:hypothetical protein
VNLGEFVQTPIAVSFTGRAHDVCTTLEHAGERGLIPTLQELARLLPQLYAVAITLPAVEPTNDQSAKSELEPDDVRPLLFALAELLGPYDSYVEIFNPRDPQPGDPVTGMLSGDLAELYLDLRNSVALLERPNLASVDVLWEWRFAFSFHWGRHLTSALRVIHALLFEEFVEALESPEV